MARTCVFCDGTPVSQEHAFPRWCGELFTDEVVNFNAFVQEADGTETSRPWQGRPFSVRVGGPCDACNSGWMSDLETQAAPVLKPMVRGERTELDAPTQLLVATWAVKTMLMVVLVTAPEARELLRYAYRWLYDNRMPPPSEQVWVAHYAGEGQWPATFHFHAVGLARPGGEPPVRPNAHGASLAVGHFAFGLAGHELEDGPAAEPRVASDTLRPIWPTYGDRVEFPPPTSHAGDDEMRALAMPSEWREP